jgi:hypothetical protein
MKTITPSIRFIEAGIVDGFGRLKQTQTAVPSTTCSGGVAYVDTTYDLLGRKATVSNPDCSASASDDVIATFTYDPLNRVRRVTEQDGSTTGTDYSYFPCTTVTDETGKQRKSCLDGLGRLTGVWEDPSNWNYETDYQYDALDNLTQVYQKGGDSDSSKWRPRSFTYDSLSRLTQATDLMEFLYHGV